MGPPDEGASTEPKPSRESWRIPGSRQRCLRGVNDDETQTEFIDRAEAEVVGTNPGSKEDALKGLRTSTGVVATDGRLLFPGHRPARVSI